MRNNIIPCPSPLGTNRERLFLVRRSGPTMALDQEPDDMPDTGSSNGGGDDLSDKIHQLLDGKLESADIEALIALIMGDEQDGPTQQPPNIATDAMIRRHLAAGAQARARLGMEQRAALQKRFPALATARVV